MPGRMLSSDVITMYLADLDGRRGTGEPWKTRLECCHLTERTATTRVDCCDTELVRCARLKFQTLQSVVIGYIHHINVLRPATHNTHQQCLRHHPCMSLLFYPAAR